jgi:uncharacterized beta-barrel protein YwiB (DUF1934 family)
MRLTGTALITLESSIEFDFGSNLSSNQAHYHHKTRLHFKCRKPETKQKNHSNTNVKSCSNDLSFFVRYGNIALITRFLEGKKKTERHSHKSIKNI